MSPSDLPELPAFLDRKTWTPSDFKKNDQAWERKLTRRAQAEREQSSIEREARQIRSEWGLDPETRGKRRPSMKVLIRRVTEDRAAMARLREALK
jgi:hypothetical protein